MFRTLTSSALLLGALAAAGCLAAPDDDAPITDEQSQDIIGGTTDTGDPSVVLIFTHQPGESAGFICTGTVIAPRTVLTAAHCVDPREVGPGNVFEVLLGTQPPFATSLAVSATFFDPQFDRNNLTAGHDVGIVQLAQATTLSPIAFDRGTAAPQVGSSIRIVGYGASAHDNSGAATKRAATTTVRQTTSTLIKIGSSARQTCHGDSGGPAFQTRNGVSTVVGITSFGSDQSDTSVCFGGGFDTRVNQVLPFITSHLL